MNPTRVNLTILLAFFASVFLPPEKGCAAESKLAEEKVYTIYLRGSGYEAGIVLTGLVKEEFHGVACFTGIGIVDYTKGIRIRIPIDNVAMVMEYESEEELNALAEQFGEYPKQEGEQESDGEPASRSESDSEGSDETQPELDGRSE